MDSRQLDHEQHADADADHAAGCRVSERECMQCTPGKKIRPARDRRAVDDYETGVTIDR